MSKQKRKSLVFVVFSEYDINSVPIRNFLGFFETAEEAQEYLFTYLKTGVDFPNKRNYTKYEAVCRENGYCVRVHALFYTGYSEQEFIFRIQEHEMGEMKPPWEHNKGRPVLVDPKKRYIDTPTFVAKSHEDERAF